jgi:hypothetical protein
MKDEAGALRRELDRIGTRRGRCVPPELKVRVSAWIRARRAAGRSVAEVAADLGIAAGTVLRWSNAAVRAIVPVHVVPDTTLATVAVVSPTGFRIEGLSLADAVCSSGARMILGTSRAVRVFAYPEQIDLRKGYDGLFGLVKTGLGRDPLSGDLFLFVNKRRGACKELSLLEGNLEREDADDDEQSVSDEREAEDPVALARSMQQRRHGGSP